MRKNKDFLIGFILGIIVFILPGLLTGEGGILGWDFFKNKIFLLLIYILTSIAVYAVSCRFWALNKNKIIGYFIYLLGILVAFSLFLLLGIIALSQGTFGL